MWRIQKLEKVDVTLDFGGAGGGLCRTSALVADSTTLVNATTLTGIEDDGCAQVLVCEGCGYIECAWGGWISPRRFGNAVVWLPCFDLLSRDSVQYAPPDFLKSGGVPFFEPSLTRRLGELLPDFHLDVTPPLAAREVALFAQLVAPGQVLGEAGGTLGIRREMIVATSGEQLQAVLDHLDALLENALAGGAAVTPALGKPGPEIYVDTGKAFVTWMPLVADNTGSLRLSFDGVCAVVHGADTCTM